MAISQDISTLDNESLQHWMCRFILEVRKKDGTEYPLKHITPYLLWSSTLSESK